MVKWMVARSGRLSKPLRRKCINLSKRLWLADLNSWNLATQSWKLVTYARHQIKMKLFSTEPHHFKLKLSEMWSGSERALQNPSAEERGKWWNASNIHALLLSQSVIHNSLIPWYMEPLFMMHMIYTASIAGQQHSVFECGVHIRPPIV